MIKFSFDKSEAILSSVYQFDFANEKLMILFYTDISIMVCMMTLNIKCYITILW